MDNPNTPVVDGIIHNLLDAANGKTPAASTATPTLDAVILTQRIAQQEQLVNLLTGQITSMPLYQEMVRQQGALNTLRDLLALLAATG